ncbi:MAG: hypothetical protein SGILL_006546 [Bacillariaceae sp.]
MDGRASSAEVGMDEIKIIKFSDYGYDDKITFLQNGPFQTCFYDQSTPASSVSPRLICKDPWDIDADIKAWGVDWSNRISSATLVRIDGAYFWKENNFGGASPYHVPCALDVGQWAGATDTSYAPFIFGAKSLAIGECNELTIYDQTDYLGNSYTFSGGEYHVRDLGDFAESIKSFKIKRVCDAKGEDGPTVPPPGI